MKKLAIYIHIPFCKSKCAYCDFLSFTCINKVDEYIDALIREIESFKNPREYYVSSIFFGGGTPSLIDAGHIKRIMNALNSTFAIREDAEISIECNPGTVTHDKLSTYRALNINRISFGLQSANNDELRFLGRIHTYEEFLESYKLAKVCGFSNINIDIMSSLPYESRKSYQNTPEKVVSLAPNHISAYSLILEENTRLYNIVDKLEKKGEHIIPDEDFDREMYHYTKNFLEDNGYHRYEISNFSKEGYECKHNISYWTNDEYVGFGLGSASYLDGVRYNNLRDLERYIDRTYTHDIKENVEKLTKKDKMWEYVMLRLRLDMGFNITEFNNTFDEEFDNIYRAVTEKYLNMGLLKKKGDFISLTEKGIDVSNTVMADYIID